MIKWLPKEENPSVTATPPGESSAGSGSFFPKQKGFPQTKNNEFRQTPKSIENTMLFLFWTKSKNKT